MSAQSAVSGTSQIHLEMAEQSCRCVSADPATWFRVTRSRSQVDGPPFRAAPRPSRFPLQMPPLCSEAGVAVLPPVDSTMRQYLQFRRWKPCAVNHWNGNKTHLLIIRKHFPPSDTKTRAGVTADTRPETKGGLRWIGKRRHILSHAFFCRLILFV